ncbi:MAG: GNAT family N-acetyltransferase [Actinomycetota bacterium]|nr:GNAT family N-acetyltransferase [Actinomycetota bacterium]
MADLQIGQVESDDDLEAMSIVLHLANPDLPPTAGNVEGIRHNRDSNPDLTYVVARLDGKPAGCGYAELLNASWVVAQTDVVSQLRGRGVGTGLLAEISRVAAANGRTELQGEVRESDTESRGYFERRGYVRVGGEQAVALDLAQHDPLPVQPPTGIEIVSREERPELSRGMYEVAQEAEQDIPDAIPARSFEIWRSRELDRPSRISALTFIALAGDEVVGYAGLDDYGSDAFHGLTAVKRAWRGQGVATALKRSQIAAAKERGVKRLVTESEERNTPMRRLNEKLGYKPEPSLSTVVLRGSLLP